MRLIDADNLIKDVHEDWDAVSVWDETGDATACEIERLIDAQPTVDSWHYPSRGEYPPKGKQILAYAWNVHYVLAKYDNMRTIDEGDKDMFVTFDAYNGFIEIKKVIRWQYIVPPKEEE